MTYKEAQESYHRIQEKKSNLSKSDSAWLKEVEAYPIDERFDTETSKMALLFEIFNNNLLDGFNTVFRIGYIAGQKAHEEKGMKK